MKAQIKYFRVVDIEPNNPANSNNGGDYYFGRTIAVSVPRSGTGVPLAVRYWTSAEFEYCPVCGKFDRDAMSDEHEERYHSSSDRAELSSGDGWSDGEDITHRWSPTAWRDKDQFMLIGSK